MTHSKAFVQLHNMEEEFDGVASKGPVQTKALPPGVKLVKDIKCLVNTRMPAYDQVPGSTVTSYLGLGVGETSFFENEAI